MSVKILKLKRAIVTIELIKKARQDGNIDRIWQYINELNNNEAHIKNGEPNNQDRGRYLRHARHELMKFNPTSRYRIRVHLTHPRYRKFDMIHDIHFKDNVDTWREIIPKYINATIKQFRGYQKQSIERHDTLLDTEVVFQGERRQGRVFAKPEQVLKAYIDKNIKGLYQEKKPELINRHVGIELEFCAPISEAKLALMLFKSGMHKYVQLKEDRSLRPKTGETAFELAILLKESTFKPVLKNICDLLASVGAIATDRRCGLHVHLDMRRRNKDLVYNNLVACQDFLLKLVDPSRIDNEFCKIVKSRKMPIEVTGHRSERYKTINAIAYYKYKTLEVRMHEGSVDFKQISNWVSILIKIANHRIKLKDDINSLTTFQKRFKLDKKLNDYAAERSCILQLNNRNINESARTTMPSELNELFRRGITLTTPTHVEYVMDEQGDSN